MTAKNKASAIVLAAGSASRMGSGVNKAYMKLKGKSILRHTLDAFSKCASIAEVIVVCREGEEHLAKREAETALKIPFKVVAGGEMRQQSVKNGLLAIAADADLVCVHDAARCLVSPELIERCVKSAEAYGSGCAGIYVTDTLKKADDGYIVETVDRESLIAVQTPQAFKKDLLLKAHEQAERDGFTGTDESVLLERMSIRVRFVPVKSENIKVTTPKDLDFAGYLLSENSKNAVRVGHGYDAHRLTEGRKLILGGVEIPFEKGLLGHSDADVLTHAVMDALLGAAGLRDIGHYFPPADDVYRDADSLVLLSRVKALVDEAGYSIVNVDCTMVLQAPKISQYTEQMRKNISHALGTGLSSVNVKATTTEGMGFTGAGEGACAYAVCSLISI